MTHINLATIEEYKILTWDHNIVLKDRSDIHLEWDQIHEWLFNNCSESFDYFYNHNDWIFSFKNLEDKVKFILKWL